MTYDDKRLSLPCPHPKCDGQIPFSRDLASGEYECICRLSRIRLTWDHFVQPPHRRPRLSLLDK